LADKTDVVVEKKTVIIKASEIPTATKTIVEAEPDPGKSMATETQVVRPNTLPVSLEDTTKSESLEPLPQERVGEVILENTVEQSEDTIIVVGHELVLAEIDDQLDASNLGGFAEDENPLEYY
jgi:hypothetical protein